MPKLQVETWTAANPPGQKTQPVKTITAYEHRFAKEHAIRESKARPTAIIVIRDTNRRAPILSSWQDGRELES